MLAYPHISVLPQGKSRVEDEFSDYIMRAIKYGTGFQNEFRLGLEVSSIVQSDEFRSELTSSLEYYRHSYPSRREFDEEDTREVANAESDLEAIGRPLSVGQKLFHGGDWPVDRNGNHKNCFVTDRILSTSLCVEIAIAHATDRTENSTMQDVWVLEVDESPCPSHALVFPYEDFLKHEFEVVIERSSLIVLQKTAKISNINLFYAKLY